MSAVVADDIAQRAEQMLDLWSALAMKHVTLGAACACSMGGISLRLEDFELDIVDYLQDAGLRCGIAEVQAYFEAREKAGPEESTMGRPRVRPLVRWLKDASQGRLPQALAEWLMPRIERTLRSYAEQHGGGGFA